MERQCPTCGEPLPLIDPHKLEALKVWYAVFTALLDGPPESDQWLVEKFRLLRERIRVELHDASLN